MNKTYKNGIICFLALLFCILETVKSEVYLNTKLGQLKGTKGSSRDGKRFNIFLKIPYSQPPIGKLRFQSPVPIRPWNGTLDATIPPPLCTQLLPIGLLGDEDCLYLNVYTPNTDKKANLPVLVWIHPGRRLFGDAEPYHYGPEYFMDKPMIVITANYRLGAIGFFSTEDESATGNWGLKDQAAVLKWTREYISDFGGDPTNVTLCGESSSAVDVALHLHSPLSKGFVSKGISQSGHPMNFRTILPKGVSLSRAWSLARLTDCHNDEVKTSEQLVECLRSLSSQEIILKTYFLSYDYVLPHSTFGPVVEANSAGAFLTSHPIQEHSKTTNKVPWLLGVTTDEGSQKTLGINSRKKWWDHIIANYRRIFPELFSYEHLPNATNITEILIEKYVGERPLYEAFEEISQMFGFCTVHLGCIESAISYGGPTYFYHFDHLHEVPYVRIYLLLLGIFAKKKTGVIHGEEIRSLFYQPYLFPPVVKGRDRFISDNLINFWYNFVAFSNPNGLEGQIWKPVRTRDLEYLYISAQDISMKSKPFWEEYEYWKNLSMPPLLTSHMLNDPRMELSPSNMKQVENLSPTEDNTSKIRVLDNLTTMEKKLRQFLESCFLLREPFVVMTSTAETVFVLLVCYLYVSKCVVYVPTKLGTIRGTTMLSRDGNKFNAFLGVPYARPPIGELRFRNPKPPESWNGVLDATKYGKKCIQPWQGKIVGSEDCLHVNIYTPRNTQPEHKTGYPIWVFIYGGKKLFGEPAPYKYGPQYIMDKPVILITISYRMGPFGFLSTEDESITGNFGLKDETAALQWIRDHISSFAGDPRNVTITGGSSGAIDVNLHLFSPLSKGLFHKAISQSGQALNSDAVHNPGEGRKLAWQLGNIVGCNTTYLKTSQELAECLRKIPAIELEKATFKMTHDYILPFMLFGPVLENKLDVGAFLVEDPCLSIQRASNIPWLMGGIKDEGSQRVLTLFSKDVILDHFERNYLTLFPQYFRYSTFERAAEATDTIEARYIGDKKLNESFHEIANIYGFGNFHLGTIETASRYRGLLYLYLYDYDNVYGYLKTYLELLSTRNKVKLGAVHGEELVSLYYNPLLYPPVLDGNDRIVSDQVVNLWYNFVAFGNPNGKSNHQLWKPSSPHRLEYLHINNLTLIMKTHYFLGEEYRFWKEIGSPTLCSTLRS